MEKVRPTLHDRSPGLKSATEPGSTSAGFDHIEPPFSNPVHTENPPVIGGLEPQKGPELGQNSENKCLLFSLDAEDLTRDQLRSHVTTNLYRFLEMTNYVLEQASLLEAEEMAKRPKSHLTKRKKSTRTDARASQYHRHT